MKTKRTLWRAIGAIAIIALIGFAAVGCDSPTNNNEPPLVNRTALNAAISGAEALLLADIAVSAAGDGSDVHYSDQWTTQDVRNALQSTIEAVTAVRDNTAATQAQVDAAVTALNNSITEFNNALRPGTYGTSANNPCGADCDCGTACDCGTTCDGTECECEEQNQNNKCENTDCSCTDCNCGTSCDGTECDCDDSTQNNDCQNADCDCGASCTGANCDCDDTNQNNDCENAGCDCGASCIGANCDCDDTNQNNVCENDDCDCGANCTGKSCDCDDTNQNNVCENDDCDCGASCTGANCDCDDTNQNNDCGKLPCECLGEGDFTISFEPGITIDITIPTINLGSAEPAPTITLLNPERFDAGSIRWLSGRTGIPVPSAAITNNGATLTLDSRVHENRRGEHQITVEVRIGGALHSAFINFTVEL